MVANENEIPFTHPLTHIVHLNCLLCTCRWYYCDPPSVVIKQVGGGGGAQIHCVTHSSKKLGTKKWNFLFCGFMEKTTSTWFPSPRNNSIHVHSNELDLPYTVCLIKIPSSSTIAKEFISLTLVLVQVTWMSFPCDTVYKLFFFSCSQSELPIVEV